MAKENRPGQKRAAEKPDQQQVQAPAESKNTVEARKGRAGGKGNVSRVGGTAVPGAKSTLAKPVPTSNNPNQQQAESYNRTMRRRMEQMGSGPESQDRRMQEMQDKRKKRIDKKKSRLEERRQEIKKTLPPGGIRLGRKNLYFLIGTIAVVVLLIVLFIIIRRPF